MTSLRQTLARHFWLLLLALIAILFTGLMCWSLWRAQIPGCSVTPRYGVALPSAATEPK